SWSTGIAEEKSHATLADHICCCAAPGGEFLRRRTINSTTTAKSNAEAGHPCNTGGNGNEPHPCQHGQSGSDDHALRGINREAEDFGPGRAERQSVTSRPAQQKRPKSIGARPACCRRDLLIIPT